MCTMDEYKELDEVKEEDYFCRVEYECVTGDFTPNALMVHCKCEMPENPDVEMIKCEECGTWFHPACVDMTKQVKHFFCQTCVSKVPNLFLKKSDSA